MFLRHCASRNRQMKRSIMTVRRAGAGRASNMALSAACDYGYLSAAVVRRHWACHTPLFLPLTSGTFRPLRCVCTAMADADASSAGIFLGTSGQSTSMPSCPHHPLLPCALLLRNSSWTNSVRAVVRTAIRPARHSPAGHFFCNWIFSFFHEILNPCTHHSHF